MKNLVLKITTLLLIALLSVSVAGCNENNDNGDENTGPKVYDIHTELQNKFITSNYDLVIKYAKGTEELSKPNPITVTWDSVEGVNLYQFHLSEFDDFSDKRTFNVNTNKIDK